MTFIQVLHFIEPWVKIQETVCVFSVAFSSKVRLHPSLNSVTYKVVIQKGQHTSKQIVLAHEIKSEVHERVQALLEPKYSHPGSIFPTSPQAKGGCEPVNGLKWGRDFGKVVMEEGGVCKDTGPEEVLGRGVGFKGSSNQRMVSGRQDCKESREFNRK
ncbi:hypothetical protein BDN71DRAFT_1431128 [Pleurotus eryngii]|uniref:Uncharacterized protein n=1 Tax=Pleurotus eryngii TaxID=5323 RepID=A0A9P6A0R5_PLEER|nr:hypothetical protein BDN71DRAFT_1431128 [Pleurotus eryngii]